MFSSNSSNGDVSYIRLNAIMVNKIKAIKAKIDYWSEHNTNLCGLSGSLGDPTSLAYADLYLTNYNLTYDDADLLDVGIDTEGSARELTYYNQFAYLCGIANITPKVILASPLLKNIFVNNTNTLVIIISISLLSVSVITFFVIRKRKTN